MFFFIKEEKFPLNVLPEKIYRAVVEEDINAIKGLLAIAAEYGLGGASTWYVDPQDRQENNALHLAAKKQDLEIFNLFRVNPGFQNVNLKHPNSDKETVFSILEKRTDYAPLEKAENAHPAQTLRASLQTLYNKMAKAIPQNLEQSGFDNPLSIAQATLLSDLKTIIFSEDKLDLETLKFKLKQLLAGWWDAIQGSFLDYQINSIHPINQFCICISKIIDAEHCNRILMPTIDDDHDLRQNNVNRLQPNEFFLINGEGPKKQDFILYQELLDRILESALAASPFVLHECVPRYELVYNLGKLKDEEWEILYLRFGNKILEFKKAIESLLTESEGSILAALWKLFVDLRAGDMVHNGTEDNAGASAIKAAFEFYKFFNTLDPATKNKLLSLLPYEGSREADSFANILHRLTGEDVYAENNFKGYIETGSFEFCVNIISRQLGTIILSNANGELLIISQQKEEKIKILYNGLISAINAPTTIRPEKVLSLKLLKQFISHFLSLSEDGNLQKLHKDIYAFYSTGKISANEIKEHMGFVAEKYSINQEVQAELVKLLTSEKLSENKFKQLQEAHVNHKKYCSEGAKIIQNSIDALDLKAQQLMNGTGPQQAKGAILSNAIGNKDDSNAQTLYSLKNGVNKGTIDFQTAEKDFDEIFAKKIEGPLKKANEEEAGLIQEIKRIGTFFKDAFRWLVSSNEQAIQKKDITKGAGLYSTPTYTRSVKNEVHTFFKNHPKTQNSSIKEPPKRPFKSGQTYYTF